MAKRVTISSIGTAPPNASSAGTNEMLQEMRDFWQAKIDVVLPDRPDLIVLPEMCDAFRNHSSQQTRDWYEARGDGLLEFFRGVARDHKCHIVYPTGRVVKDGSFRNAAVFIDRSGEIIGQYNKNHIVIAETELYGNLCGNSTPIIECDIGRVAGAICFDLNFDELRLKYKALKPDLIVFPSMYHGGLMQAYWAYSCRAHFVGCVSGVPTASAIISPVGHEIASSTNYFDHVTATVNLDCAVAHLDGNGDKFIALKKKYGRDVSVFDPGELGSVLLTSESDSVGVMDMVREFEIELLDDYFARSLDYHHDPKNIGA